MCKFLNGYLSLQTNSFSEQWWIQGCLTRIVFSTLMTVLTDELNLLNKHCLHLLAVVSLSAEQYVMLMHKSIPKSNFIFGFRWKLCKVYFTVSMCLNFAKFCGLWPLYAEYITRLHRVSWQCLTRLNRFQQHLYDRFTLVQASKKEKLRIFFWLSNIWYGIQPKLTEYLNISIS